MPLPETVGHSDSPVARPFPVAAASGLTRESVVVELFKHRLIEKPQFARALIKFRLDQDLVAQLLGLEGRAALMLELAEEDVSEDSEPADLQDQWRPFTYEEAVHALYSQDPVTDIGKELGRTAKGISNFRYRMFTQGCRVSRAIWDLLTEGYEPEELSGLGVAPWMVSFTLMTWQINAYATVRRLQLPKVIFVDDKQEQGVK